MEVPLVSRQLDEKDNALKSLLDTFGSAFSLAEISSAFCKAGRDANLAGKILNGMKTDPSADATHVLKGLVKCEASSKAIDGNDYGKSCYVNRNSPKPSKSKRNPALTGTGSSIGKNCVWRIVGSNEKSNATMPLKVEAASVAASSNVSGKNCVWRVVGSNEKSNATMPLKVEAASVAASSIVRGKNCVWRVVGSNEKSNATMPLKVEAASVAASSYVRGKNCVWRIAGSNGIPDGKKPLNVEANVFSEPANTSEKPLLSRNANLASSKTSSSKSNACFNDDMENFLFEMLGRGFQLERSVIREVLGDCGYDMKKSLETLLDLSAVTLDRRNNLGEGRHLHSNSRSVSSTNQVEKQKSATRNGYGTRKANVVPSSQSIKRYEQEEEGLPDFSHAPEQPDLIVSAPVPQSAITSSVTRVVMEPLKDIAEDSAVNATISNADYLEDHVEEGSYDTLRKAVKEHRVTMREYYKAAAEAFARGDRGKAVILLEKGQFFNKKAREADEESSTKIFETSEGKVEDEVSLDLRDHDVKEAIQLVKLHLRKLSGIPLVRELKVIIGNGDRDVKKLKRLILKLLEMEGIKWIEDENCGTILIHLDEINPKSLSFGRKNQQI